MQPITEPRSLFIDLGRGRRHVAEWGQRGDPVLLLLHGMRDHARSWDWVAEHFARDHHVIAPDLRGHGDSDWSRDGAYSLSDYIIDLADIVDTLELPQFDLVGHSLGGHLVLRYAAAYPEKIRSLCVIEGIELPIIRDQRRNPTPYPGRLRRWIDDQQARRNRESRYYVTPEDAQVRMAAEHPLIDGHTIAHLSRHGLVAVAGKGLRWKYDNACRLRAPDDAHGIDLEDILDAIACPTLLAYGLDSWIPVPPPERLNRMCRHRLMTFEGAGHWLHHQAREPFLSALTRFLSEPDDFITRKRPDHA